MEYSVCKTADEDQIEDFLNDHFFPDLPLDLAFGISGLPRPPPPQVPATSKFAGDFSLKALDSKGQIVGVAINRANHIAPGSFVPENIKEFFDFIEEAAELKNLPEKTIEFAKLSVRKDWRGRGVAKRLVEESMKEARNSGFKAMTICCLSEYSAKIVRSLGWREHYRIALKDYPQLSGKEVTLKPVPPHEFVYYYVIDL